MRFSCSNGPHHIPAAPPMAFSWFFVYNTDIRSSAGYDGFFKSAAGCGAILQEGYIRKDDIQH